MRPIVIEGATLKFGAPDGRDDVSTLHIREEEVAGMRFHVSAWEPSPEEIEKIKAGAPVWLWISSPTHPVVAMSVPHPPSST